MPSDRKAKSPGPSGQEACLAPTTDSYRPITPGSIRSLQDCLNVNLRGIEALLRGEIPPREANILFRGLEGAATFFDLIAKDSRDAGKKVGILGHTRED